ncbi:MAG: hypothetical protein JRD68_07055 [Deltaproteobacteria bacterium]|nr:hypothetical protein [Deltaproteobacteria bacterium]
MEKRKLYLENWREEYKRKLVSAEEAARAVKSGDNIFFASAYYGQVAYAIAARADELRGVNVEYQAPLFDPGWLAPGMEESFRIIVRIFMGATAREIHDEGRLEFLPYTNGTWSKPYRDDRPGKREIDVFLDVVSPPDENGFMTFGHQIWERRGYADRAKVVIAEIDEHLIKSRGDTLLHVSQVDYLVDITSPPATDEEIDAILTKIAPEKRERARIAAKSSNPRRIHNLAGMLDDVTEDRLELLFGLEEPNDEARAITENMKPLLRDRDTIQIGIGKPSKFIVELGVFDHLKDLSIFTEMPSPGMAGLIKRGIATGKYASVYPGKAVMASLGGLRLEEIQWAENNPLIEQYSSDHIVNIARISQNENMVAINNAVQVDLTGQITCETQFGTRLLNGPGGQIEFHIGAFSAPGGRAITLLPSTWGDGGVSNIVAQMDQGTLVSVPRVFADYIVTEWGVAELCGKTHRERAQALIEVAHPDFRDELKEAAKDIF